MRNYETALEELRCEIERRIERVSLYGDVYSPVQWCEWLEDLNLKFVDPIEVEVTDDIELASEESYDSGVKESKPAVDAKIRVQAEVIDDLNAEIDRLRSQIVTSRSPFVRCPSENEPILTLPLGPGPVIGRQ